MIRQLLKISALLLMITATACKKDDVEEPDEWVKGSDFEGIPRSGAASFEINGRVYVTGGFDGTKRLNDLWYYDKSESNWFPVKGGDFPGKARNYAVAFSANGKGYVGTGSDGSADPLADFYEFDPEKKSWKKIADFPGEARYGAVALSAGNKSVVGSGTGVNGDFKDFYTYNSSSDGWEQVKSLPGSKRANAFTFTINGLAYIGGGKNNGVYLTDFWSYNVNEDKWVQLNDIKREDKDKDINYNLMREFASTFVISGMGYISGGTSGQILASTWRYDPATDIWKQHQDIKGSSRESAIGFSLDNKGYITTGRRGSYRFDDTWIFTPNK